MICRQHFWTHQTADEAVWTVIANNRGNKLVEQYLFFGSCLPQPSGSLDSDKGTALVGNVTLGSHSTARAICVTRSAHDQTCPNHATLNVDPRLPKHSKGQATKWGGISACSTETCFPWTINIVADRSGHGTSRLTTILWLVETMVNDRSTRI